MSFGCRFDSFDWTWRRSGRVPSRVEERRWAKQKGDRLESRRNDRVADSRVEGGAARRDLGFFFSPLLSLAEQHPKEPKINVVIISREESYMSDRGSLGNNRFVYF
jgi:hypothetical protein